MKKLKRASKFIYFLITLSFFVGVNLYCSNLIVNKVSNGWASGQSFSNNLVDFIYVKNTGAAFSIMQNSTNFLIILSSIAILLMIYYIIKNIDSLFMKEVFCISLLMAGILGNLYERVFFGYVRDFFDLTFMNFPVFNISDVFINVGVFAIIVLILLTKKPIKLI